ncbi:MAG: glycoside hydrolase family 15 protein [Actinomycetota bacterium]|nr:glycoside hydrolase family 15 protein [Actinomycetota bacterium]
MSALCGATLVAALGVPTPAASAAASAPGAPGALSHFDLARKDCLGTARNTSSKVWFTVAGGVLSDVYYPTIDNTNAETLQYVVTDGRTFTDLQTRDTTYSVRALDRSGMACEVTSTARSGRYSIVTDYFTDPQRDSVVLRTRLRPASGSPGALKLYVRFDPTVNGNGGGGVDNAGADDAVIDRSTGAPVPVASDTSTETIAANRDYAQPVFAALRADRPFLGASSGYARTASDGLAQLDSTHRLDTTYDSAPHGNVVQTALVDTRDSDGFTMALGFGATQAAAVATAGASARRGAQPTLSSYLTGWAAYDGRLNSAPSQGLPPARAAALASAYYVSANVLKASEDKTFPGAIVASMASPWGQAVSAGDPNLTYFGSYREVFARDLYETFTGLLATGDRATAEATVRFLFERQQQPDGSIPRNSLLNGKTAPDSFGVQLDEVSYPILMARTVGLIDATFYRDHIKKAADFVVAHGPAFGSERWEEQSGFSPSTIAAEIAGLTAAGAIAAQNGDLAGARIYRGTADHYQRNIKAWTRTTNGPLSAQPYFIRLSKSGDPNAATTYNLGNGGPDADQRTVVDAGFLELTRLGALPAGDADVARSLGIVDQVIARQTASGLGFYRYGTPSTGTEDGYGDCNVADSTDCTVQGKPWAGTCEAQSQNRGSGHLWPALAGERAEHHLALAEPGTAVALWDAMAQMASGVGLIPEQAWENSDLAASPFGTPPECASIGFVNGKSVGSASPLTWSAAQFARLAGDIKAGRIVEQPPDTVSRYVQHTQGEIPLTLTAPADNSLVTGTTTVTGTTAPGATVDVTAINTDIDGSATTATTAAGADGSFSVDLPVPPGTDSITAVATAADGATGFAQRTVVFDVVPGTAVFGTTDPTGDDNGPGTYEYPTAGDFKPGAYDVQQFQVYDSSADTVTFRVQTRDLTPTFGSPLGAQLVDVYVQNPAGGPQSTAASFPGRNYAIDAGSAWNRLIEVQGFGQRFIDGTGRTVGSVQIRANAVTRFITFTVTKAALGGTPASGWKFAVVLTGQDGFSSDQARGFSQPAGAYSFGVCTVSAVAAGNPICGVDPATVPKALDVLTPAGVDQATELDPTQPPVTIAAVSVA